MLLIGPHSPDVALRLFFFFNDTATTEIYTLSLHDALPIWRWNYHGRMETGGLALVLLGVTGIFRCQLSTDRKSTRLNSSHANISYAVFCLKKKTRHRSVPPAPRRSPRHDPGPPRPGPLHPL